MKEANDQLFYLKSNLIVEPLFDMWYAWSHLISPATSSRNIKHRHIEIMDSFIENPIVHEMAVKNPRFRGGPFIDHPSEKLDQIKTLRDKTVEKQKIMLEFSDAIDELNSLLKNEAKGFSLKPLYDKIPKPLQGYVELFYDLNGNPLYRIFEGLLYKSPYYDTSSQSVLLKLTEDDEDRSFVLSTPRLVNDNNYHLKVPFKSELLDDLFKMETEAKSYSELKNKLNIDEKSENLFRSFFTEEKPKEYEPYTGEGIRTRYFGHACVLIETKSTSILVDPLISYDYDTDLPRYTYRDLPDEIDFVLITHNHQDHLLYETLLRLRHKIKNIIVPKCGLGNLQDPNMRLNLKHVGFENVHEIADFDELSLLNCVITGLPFLGEHGDLDIRSKLCYHIRVDNRFSVVFFADSNNISPFVYEHVQKIIGDIDVMFLGMECDGAPMSWLYGPLLGKRLEGEKDMTRRLDGSDFNKGLDLVKRFNPKDVFVYAMGMEPWLEFLTSVKYTDESRPIIESNNLIEQCSSMGINAERLYGEKTIIY